MMLDITSFIFFFYSFIDSRFGVFVIFGLIVTVILTFGVRAALKSLSKSFVHLLLWIIIPCVTMLVYGFSGFDAKFLFFIPIWDEFVYDNVMSIMGAMLIIVYTSIIIFKYYKKDVMLKFNLYEYLIGAYLIVGIIAYVVIPVFDNNLRYYTAGDMYIPHIILLCLGFISRIYGNYAKDEDTQKNFVYIGNVLFYAGLLGFILVFVIEELSVYLSTIGGASICVLGIVKRKRAKEKREPLIEYCIDHLDEDICQLHFLNLDAKI